MIKKPAETEVEIAPLISERWSPRVFDPDFIIDEVSVKSILEAARWAPSCFGDQPWKFIIFQKKDALQWVNALNCLSVGNQNWAMDTSLLICVCANKKFVFICNHFIEDVIGPKKVIYAFKLNYNCRNNSIIGINLNLKVLE